MCVCFTVISVFIEAELFAQRTVCTCAFGSRSHSSDSARLSSHRALAFIGIRAFMDGGGF